MCPTWQMDGVSPKSKIKSKEYRHSESGPALKTGYAERSLGSSVQEALLRPLLLPHLCIPTCPHGLHSPVSV